MKQLSVIVFFLFLLPLQGHLQSSIDYDLFDAVLEEDTALVRKLINEGADVNAATWEGVTPIMYAAETNNFNLVQLLLDYGADINAKPWNGLSALLASVKAGYLEMSEFLIRNGANYDDTNIDGISSLLFAVANNDFYMADMLLYYEADAEQKDKQGNTALLLAAWYGNPDLVKLLIDAGARIDALDKKGNSLLHKAVESNKPEIVSFALEQQLNPDYVNYEGITSLALAAKNGAADIATLLIKKGASVDFPENKTKTPVSVATFYNQKEILELLEENGATISRKPVYNTFSAGIGNQINTSVYETGITIGINDLKYKSYINFEFLIRPWKLAMLYPGIEPLYYQYWERRYYLGFGIGKDFILKSQGLKQKGIFVDFKTLYSFGSFSGTLAHPDPLLLAVPSAGYVYRNNNFRFNLGYQYKNLKTIGISNHFIIAGISYQFKKNIKESETEYLYE